MNTIIVSSASLQALAGQIQTEHDLAQNAFRTALDHARNCGLLLLRAKEQCQHGDWQPWLKANVRFAERTAQAYMKIAREWGRLEGKSATGCGFGVREALEFLAEPGEPRRLELRSDVKTTSVEEIVYLPKMEAGHGYQCKARREGTLLLVAHPDDPECFGMVYAIESEDEDRWGKYWRTGGFYSIAKDPDLTANILRGVLLQWGALPDGEWVDVGLAGMCLAYGYFGLRASKAFMSRVTTYLTAAFAEVYPQTAEQWRDGLEHDSDGAKEVARWLVMADVFTYFTQGREMGQDTKDDIFRVILERSLGQSPTTPATQTAEAVQSIRARMDDPKVIHTVLEKWSDRNLDLPIG